MTLLEQLRRQQERTAKVVEARNKINEMLAQEEVKEMILQRRIHKENENG